MEIHSAWSTFRCDLPTLVETLGATCSFDFALSLVEIWTQQLAIPQCCSNCSLRKFGWGRLLHLLMLLLPPLLLLLLPGRGSWLLLA